MRKSTCWLVGAALLVLPLTASSQGLKPADRSPWEISGSGGVINDIPNFGPDGSPIFSDLDWSILFGVGVNYHFPSGFFVGVDGKLALLDTGSPVLGIADLNTYFVSGVIGYTYPVHDRLDLYGVGGAAGALWTPAEYEKELGGGFTVGAGFRAYLTETIAFTGDYRMTPIFFALADVSQVDFSETYFGNSFSAGLSYFFGGKSSDSDGDGVKDRDDSCPDTQAGAEVDARGCAVDTDGDGVADYQDGCPNTTAGARVDGGGCPMDADADGVFDGLDRCPATPRGAEVDGSGCPMDADADRVFDGLDRCPATPMGTEVDGSGCPVPASEPEGFTFEGSVNFGFDSAELTPQIEAALRVMGETLMAHAGVAIILEGHADNEGAWYVNHGLSLERAYNVRDFLVENFPQLAAGEFSVVGIGDTRPTADNTTAQGRAQNRRVVVIVR